MKRSIITIAVLLMAAMTATATTISIDLGPPKNTNKSEKSFSFDLPGNLQGLAFDGQTLSLDFVFDNSEFVRLFPSTDSSIDLGFDLKAFGVGAVTVPASGYLFDSAHNPIPSIVAGGTSVIIDPPGSVFSVGPGFFPLDPAIQNVNFPLDIYGAHVDIRLPTAPNFHLTDTGSFGIFPHGTRGGNQFAIGPHVRDTGSTVVLFATGIVALMGGWGVGRAATRTRP
jgi:hypothetical protein